MRRVNVNYINVKKKTEITVLDCIMSNKIILFLHTVKHLNYKTNKRQEKYRAEDLKKECMQVIHTQDKKRRKLKKRAMKLSD